MDYLISQINKAIIKFEQQEYDEAEFHSTIESIIHSITESDRFKLRDFLSLKEADLEEIDFMVSRNSRRSEYLKIVSQIREYMLLNYS